MICLPAEEHIFSPLHSDHKEYGALSGYLDLFPRGK